MIRIQNQFLPWYLHWLGNPNPRFENCRSRPRFNPTLTRNIYKKERAFFDLATLGSLLIDCIEGQLRNLGFQVESLGGIEHLFFTIAAPEIGKGGFPAFPVGRYQLTLRVYGKRCRMAERKITLGFRENMSIRLNDFFIEI